MNRLAPALANRVRTLTCQHESQPNGLLHRTREPIDRTETATPLPLTRRPRMSWSINIGTIAGTAVRVHVTFLLFLGWIFGASWVAGGPEAAWQALAFLVLLFA